MLVYAVEILKPEALKPDLNRSSHEFLFIFRLKHLPRNSIVLFQMVGHNPTGADPTKEQWREMSHILKDRQILVFFDMAYQGFGSGSTDEDAFPLRHFIEDGHRVVFAQSYSKLVNS